MSDTIKKSARQLRAYRESGLPTVVVLYDNKIVDGVRPYPRCPYFDRQQIEWAMYGRHVADFQVPIHGEAIHLADRRGGNRQLTDRQRRCLSGLAILSERGESAWFYHNYFAAIPLLRAVLRDERDRHFHNPRHPHQHPVAGWSELACHA
ncbi:MAG TPA: hypothetical protein VGJ81_16360 [Thermoanaerobaculia bacterium]